MTATNTESDGHDSAILTSPVLRPMRSSDSDAVLSIYEEGIATGHATFADAAPSWEDFDAGHMQECRLVAELDGVVVGWGTLSGVSSRCVYRGVAETSVYVAAAARGRAVGRALMSAVISESEAADIWTLQAGCFPENEGSLRLHQALGFRVVGLRQKIGLMTHGPLKGQWRDVVFLERRSTRAGR